jgi:hypothetical protein
VSRYFGKKIVSVTIVRHGFVGVGVDNNLVFIGGFCVFLCLGNSQIEVGGAFVPLCLFLMGQNKSLLANIEPLKESLLVDLCAKYGFTTTEIEQLHKYYAVIAGSVEDDGKLKDIKSG